MNDPAIFNTEIPASKQKIMASAMELFAKNGFIPTTVDSIAKKAGLSKGSIYNYFKSKEDIFEVIIHSILYFADNIKIEVEKIEDPVVQLELIVTQSAEYCKKDPEFSRLYMSCFFQPELYPIVKEHVTGFYNEWKGMVEGIFRKLKIKKPDEEAMIFLALLDGLQLHYLFELKGYDINSLSKNIVDKYKEMYQTARKKQ